MLGQLVAFKGGVGAGQVRGFQPRAAAALVLGKLRIQNPLLSVDARKRRLGIGFRQVMVRRDRLRAFLDTERGWGSRLHFQLFGTNCLRFG